MFLQGGMIGRGCTVFLQDHESVGEEIFRLDVGWQGLQVVCRLGGMSTLWPKLVEFPRCLL